ncbi:serine hydrolase [Polycladidibacter hongkongensis]|uniref:serine hydrolase n=1 Tax=Polycladidibacter hongkongensis TaxID=1647556 RepID=UPI000B29F05B|nr:serine hydrolase [Pseudovibrio hongkongensis]
MCRAVLGLTIATGLLTGFGPGLHKAAANPKYAGIVVDAKTGKVLYAENANARRYPASTTKIMTLFVLFEELEAGRLSLNTRMKVSRYAAGRPPTKLYLKAGSTLRVKDAIYALITKSANDASTVIAEHISGSEAAFAKRMTSTARAIGMRNTTFRNPHGLPNSRQVTTAADLALLGRAMQDRFPKYYKYFNTRSYTYAGRRMGNHNKLLGRVRGVDGIKTGYTRASGYNLVTNVERDNRHIVAVVLGGRSGKRRDAQMVKLINRYLPKASRGKRTAPLLMARTKLTFPKVAPATPTLKARPATTTVMAYAPESQTKVKQDPIAQMLQSQASLTPIANPKVSEVSIDDAVKAALASNKAKQLPPNETTLAKAPSAAQTSVPMAAPIPMANPSSAEKAPEKAASTEEMNGWQVQISASDSREKAVAILQKARKAAGTALRDYDIYTQEVKTKKQTLYRARFTGFETKTAAWDACAKLKRVKYSCYAIYQ